MSANDDGTVCGIENSSKRCVTADFIKFLRDKNFAGGFIPQDAYLKNRWT